MASKNGLSKTTTLQHDIAKKGAVKVGGKHNIGDNHRGSASNGGSTTPNPGGKLSPKALNGTGRKK